MKRPAFQFYPSDWRKDMALQSCSVAARGLWIDLLCIAHECEPYGHLTVNGKPMTAAQIGRHTGLTQREAERLLSELDEAGVLSRTPEGAIYSRRMVRDEDLRNRRAEGGKAGSEHGHKGAAHGSKGGRPKKGRGVSEPPLEPPPSSSSSSSTSEELPDTTVDVVARTAPQRAASAAPTTRGTRLPAGWQLPRDWGQWALEQPGWTEPAVRTEGEKFRDYWAAKPGRDGVKLDWQATWRNWIRNATPSRAGGVVPLQGRQAAIEAHNQAVMQTWLASEGAS